MKAIKKPSLGVMPRFIWLEHRRLDIEAAIVRYRKDKMDIPKEWEFELEILNKFRRYKNSNQM